MNTQQNHLSTLKFIPGIMLCCRLNDPIVVSNNRLQKKNGWEINESGAALAPCKEKWMP